MALPSQVIDVPFTQGVDTKSDSKLTAKLARLENYMFKGGTLVKRPGCAALTANTNGSPLTTGESVDTFDSELVRINGGGVYSLSSTSTKWIPISTGNHLATFSSKRISRNAQAQLGADHATLNGLTVTSWLASDGTNYGVCVSAFDEATGVFYATGEHPLSGTANATVPRCVVAGASILVLWTDVVAGTVRCCVVNASTLVSGVSSTLLRSDVTTATGIPLQACASGSNAAVCYINNTAGARNYTVMLVDGTGTVSASPAPAVLAATATTSAGFMALAQDTAGRIFLLAQDSSNVLWYTCVSASTLATFLTKTIVKTPYAGSLQTFTLVESSTNVMTVVAGGVSGLNSAVITASGISTAFASISNTFGCALFSEATVFDGVVAFAVGYTGSANVQPQAMVVTLTGDRIGRFLPGTFGFSTSNLQRLARPISPSTGGTAFLFAERGRTAYASVLDAIVDLTPNGVTRVTLTAATADRLPRTRIGQTLYLGGAQPRIYDGQHFVCAGFGIFPDPAIVSLLGGGALSAGTYQWRVVYSWTDARGQLLRSAASIAVSAVATAGQQATLTLPCVPYGEKPSMQIEVYRTSANGTVFYRCSAVGGIYSTTAASTVSFTDNVSDADLAVNEILYTTGGVYDNIAPPAYLYSTAFKDRLVIAGLEDPFEARFSTRHVNGEALRFNEAFSFRVSADTGAITGLETLDDKLVIFTERTIYVIVGDGPDPLGNGTFSQAQEVSTDTGCVAAASIVSYPDGILFLGNQGVCELSRGLELTYIGADVESYSSYTFREATVLGNLDQVRFHCDTGSDTGSGVALVYDYMYKQWSVWTGYGARCAAIWNGTYVRVRSDGAVLQESASLTTDAGVPFYGVIETAWLKLAGLQGFQRVRRALLLGQVVSDTVFTWEAAYDYSATYNALDLVTVTTSGTWTAGTPFQARHHLRVQKCEAVRFRLTETAESSPYGGISFTGLALEVAQKQGHFRGLTSGKSV